MKTKISILILFLILACKNERTQESAVGKHSNSTTSAEKKQKKFVAKNIGDTLDVYNNVYVFYNKSINNTSGRNVTPDGYNVGLKWQCVEFVKRYYYEHLNHKMPNSYGHAKDFFNPKVADGVRNKDRNLVQYTNGSASKPKLNDLVVFKGNTFNPYGHVAIISKVSDHEIEIVQQNVGKDSRETMKLSLKNGKWTIKNSLLLGWLRKS